jgi:hypothetical protein
MISLVRSLAKARSSSATARRMVTKNFPIGVPESTSRSREWNRTFRSPRDWITFTPS